MKKDRKMNELLDKFSESFFGIKRTDAHRTSTCVLCKGDVNYFRNEISRKEFAISSICQHCQDKIFGKD